MGRIRAGIVWAESEQGSCELDQSRDHVGWIRAGIIWAGSEQGSYGLGQSRDHLGWNRAGIIWAEPTISRPRVGRPEQQGVNL